MPNPSMQVAQLWRYPIKSLRGEPLESAELTLDGVLGDRIIHVHGKRGPLTGRGRHGLLTIPARTGADGTPLVDGHRWDSPEAAALLKRATGDDAEFAAYAGPERFDILNLLVATDGAVAALGEDVRRLRPNLLVAGVPAEAEATWRGRALAIGDARIGIHSLRDRCVVTTVDPDSGDQDLDVLRRIRRDFGGQLALNCWVIRPGVVRVADEVRLVDCKAEPEHIGGWLVGAPYAPTRASGRRPQE